MKSILLWGVFLSFIPFSYAQSSYESTYFNGEKKFYGGTVIGLNATQVDGDGFSGFHRAGLNAGGIVYWHFLNYVGLSVEFLYSQKGSSHVQETSYPYAGSYFAKYKMKLNYVEVPLIFHFFYNKRIHFGFGASYNALLSSKEEHSFMGMTVIDQELAEFNNYSIDLIGSVTYMLWEGIFINARYQYGITPVRDYQFVPNGFGNGNQFNNMFSFKLGYLF